MLMILCADGLDSEYAADLGLHMPHERALDIPEELIRNDGYPHTLDIWPSMFTGEVHIYPIQIGPGVAPNLRNPIRKWLHGHGIKWRRRGIIFNKSRKLDANPIHSKIYEPSVNSTVLNNYRSFSYGLPAISYDCVFGGGLQYAIAEFNTVSDLAQILQFGHFNDISALYFRILDSVGHRHPFIDEALLDSWYSSVFVLAASLRCPVMLVSDHGCINGRHTQRAYLGCTEPIYSQTVLDVAEDIKNIMNGDTHE